MSAPRHTIFISYRRRDSIYAVDRLDERLKQAFGEQAVFRDVRSIRKGHSFPDDLRGALKEATVGIVVIGPWWLETDDVSPARRRIDEPDDWVRVEVESLLQRTLPSGEPIPVIPVLIGGAKRPQAADLPDSLKLLPHRDGQHLHPEPDFEHSVGQLIEHVGKHLGVTPLPFVPGKHQAPEQPPRVSATRLNVTGKNFVGREQELLLLDEAWGRSGNDKINIVSLIGQGGEGKTALVIEWYSRRAHLGWPGVRRVFDWSFYSQGTSAQSSASADEFFNAAFAWFDKTVEVPKDSWTKGAKLAELVAAERTLLVLDGLEPLQQPPGDYGGEFKDPAMKALLRGLALHNPGLCLLTSRTDITDLSSYEHSDGTCLRHPLHSLDPVAARALLRELGVLGPDKELDEAIEWFHRHAYDLNLLGNFLRECTTDHDILGWQQKFPIMKEDERIHPVPDAAGKRAGHGRRMLRAYERWLGPDSPATSILRLLGLFDRPVRSDLLDELRAEPVILNLTAALVPLPNDEWLRTLDQLEQLALISRERMSLPAEKAGIKNMEDAKRPRRLISYTLDCHPLLREHFAAELRERSPVAPRQESRTPDGGDRAVDAATDSDGSDAIGIPVAERQGYGNAWQEGHRRLYEYLCATTPDKPDATLEDLQPLYQAVAHGCHAGLQEEARAKVYRDRIQRGDEAYSTKKLGALGADLGAIACFFETPWSRVSPALTEATQAWLLNEAAFRLRALGRLTEALEPMRAGIGGAVKLEDWNNAAIYASNLSGLALTLGEVAGAVGDAEQSVTYADRSDDAFTRMANRTVHADALHQAGRRAEAETLFREAEVLQVERQPGYPLLYSLQGFRYCDLILTETERAAWQCSPHAPREGYIAACHAVSERAAKMFEWRVPGDSLLDIALDHLTLGRAAFFAVLIAPLGPRGIGLPPVEQLSGDKGRLEADPAVELAAARRELDAAVSGLRRAGTSHHLPRGLLTRAWLRFVEGNRTGFGSAQSDLDEAWEIAERGSMKLFMADVLLYRARLFGVRSSERGVRSEGEEKYPWVSAAADLDAAEALINSCGYHRRDEELADAKAALL